MRPGGWLGDPDAFAEYQRAYHDDGRFQPPPEFYESREREEDMKAASGMSAGMHAVVDGPATFTEGGIRKAVIPKGGAHPTVGEAIMTAQPRAEDNLFAYSTQNRAVAPAFAEPPPGQAGVIDSGFGSPELGSFSYSVMTPAQPGVGVVGVYFHEGRLGVLYAPLVRDEPEHYPNVTQDQFEERVRMRNGVTLQGFGFGFSFSSTA